MLIDDLNTIPSPNLVSGRYLIETPNNRFDVLLRRHRNIEILFVFFPEYKGDNKINCSRPDHDIQNLSYDKYFSGSVLYIIDDYHKKFKEFIKGSGAEDYFADMASLIKIIARKLHVNTCRIIVFGSGFAGYIAIQIANLVPGAIACAINPVINICDYCYDDPESIPVSVKKEYSLAGSLEKFDNTKIFFALDANNLPYYNEQYKPLFESEIMARHNFCLFEYSDQDMDNIEDQEAMTVLQKQVFKFANIKNIKKSIGKITSTQLYLIKSPLYDEDLPKVYFQPPGRTDIEKTRMDFPFDWNADPYGDANWQAQLHMWRMVDDYIYKFEETRHRRWLFAPKFVIWDWYRYYKFHEAGPYVWRTMTTGLRAMKIAYFLNLHQTGRLKSKPRFIAACLEMAETHLNFLLDESSPDFSNHALIDINALAALAQSLSPVYGRKIYNFIEKIFPQLLARQFDENNIHQEHSPQYHAMGVAYLRRLQKSGWFNGFGLEEIIAGASRAQSWFNLPDGRVVPIGDTDGAVPDPLAIAGGQHEEGLFAKSGNAIVRASQGNGNESYLFFMGSFNSGTHKHSDDLSLFWHENEDILCDAGKYAYQNSAKRDYVISTHAHNTLEVDGSNTFDPKNPASNCDYGNKLDKFFCANGLYYLGGSVEIKRSAVTHSRQVVFNPGKFLFVVDIVLADKIHEYQINWHFSPEIDIISQCAGNILAQLASGMKLYVSLGSFIPQKHISMLTGQTVPRLQGFISRGYRDLQPALCISCAVKAKGMVFTSCFSLGAETQIKVLGRNKYQIVYGNECHRLDISA